MSTIISTGKHMRIYNVQLHRHEAWEFIYCTSGNGTLSFKDAEDIPYESGDAVAIPPYVYHVNSSKLGFTNIFMTVGNVSFPFKGPIRVTDDSDRRILSAFSEAYYFSNSDIPRRDMLLNSLADLIVSYMTVFYDHKPFSEPVGRIRDEIIKNFADSQYKVEDTLNEMPASYDYLRKLFKKETGQTPLDFLTEARMKLAERLLSVREISEYNITEIAEMCGYADALYFSRVFKKRVGVSPSTYSHQFRAIE